MPVYASCLCENFGLSSLKEITWEDIDNICDDNYCISDGAVILVGYLANQIGSRRYANNVDMFLLCEDFDGEGYIMFTPSYPWNKTWNEPFVNLTTEGIASIFKDLFADITDDGYCPEIDYQSCENGG